MYLFKTLYHWLVFSAVVSARTFQQNEQQILSGEKWLTPEFDKLVAQLMDKYKVPGLSIAIVDGDETSAKGYGIANNIGGHEERVTAETLFYTGSTTKAFTAAAMSLLVDDNTNFPNVQWRTPISHLIRDDFVLSDDRWTEIITIEDALSHRTGMYGHDLSYGGDNRTTVRDIVRSLRYLPFAEEPRTEYIYCNMMFVAISHVIEVLTGSWLGDFLKVKIWEPLGMDSTYFSLDDAKKSHNPLARGYYWDNGTQSYYPTDYMVMPYISGAGTIISNVLDYSKWLRTLINQDTPISKKAHAELIHPRTILPSTYSYGPILTGTYALGWVNAVVRNVTLIHHDGGLRGFGAQVAFIPQLSKGVVLMGNTHGTSNSIARILTQTLVEQFLGIAPEEGFDWETFTWNEYQATKQLSDPKKARERLFPNTTNPHIPLPLPISSYAGTYHNLGYESVTIFVNNDEVLEINWNRTWPFNATFEHVSGDHFFVTGQDSQQRDMTHFTRAEFHIDANGIVDRFSLMPGDLEGNISGSDMTLFDRV